MSKTKKKTAKPRKAAKRTRIKRYMPSLILDIATPDNCRELSYIVEAGGGYYITEALYNGHLQSPFLKNLTVSMVKADIKYNMGKRAAPYLAALDAFVEDNR